MIQIATFLMALIAGTANPSAADFQHNAINNDHSVVIQKSSTKDDESKEDKGNSKDGIGTGDLGGN